MRDKSWCPGVGSKEKPIMAGNAVAFFPALVAPVKWNESNPQSINISRFINSHIFGVLDEKMNAWMNTCKCARTISGIFSNDEIQRNSPPC